MRLSRRQRCRRTPAWAMWCRRRSGLGTATWTAGLYGQRRGACDPVACVVPRRTDPGPPTIIPGPSQTTNVEACCSRRLGRRPHHRRRPAPLLPAEGGRRHDSRRAREGVPPARRAGGEQDSLESCEAIGCRRGVPGAGADRVCLPGAELAAAAGRGGQGIRTRSPTTSRSRMSRRWSRIRRS